MQERPLMKSKFAELQMLLVLSMLIYYNRRVSKHFVR